LLRAEKLEPIFTKDEKTNPDIWNSTKTKIGRWNFLPPGFYSPLSFDVTQIFPLFHWSNPNLFGDRRKQRSRLQI